MGVNHCHFDVAMAQQFLNSSNVIPPIEPEGGERIGKKEEFLIKGLNKSRMFGLFFERRIWNGGGSEHCYSLAGFNNVIQVDRTCAYRKPRNNLKPFTSDGFPQQRIETETF